MQLAGLLQLQPGTGLATPMALQGLMFSRTNLGVRGSGIALVKKVLLLSLSFECGHFL